MTIQILIIYFCFIFLHFLINLKINCLFFININKIINNAELEVEV
jgi:hypothetical protein